MVMDQRQHLCCTCSMAFALCLISLWVTVSKSQPSEHGLWHEKDPGGASRGMAAFFQGRPEVALPEAQNVTDPAWRAAARAVPLEAVHDGARGTRSALLIAGVVFGVVGVGLLSVAAVAYIVHARRSRTWTGSRPLVDLTWWRAGSEVRLGAV